MQLPWQCIALQVMCENQISDCRKHAIHLHNTTTQLTTQHWPVYGSSRGRVNNVCNQNWGICKHNTAPGPPTVHTWSINGPICLTMVSHHPSMVYGLYVVPHSPPIHNLPMVHSWHINGPTGLSMVHLCSTLSQALFIHSSRDWTQAHV